MITNFRFSSLSFFWQLLLLFFVVTIFPLFVVLFWQQAQLEAHLLDDRSQQLWRIAQEKKHYMQLMTHTQKNAVQLSSLTPLLGLVLKKANHLAETETLNKDTLALLDELGTSFLAAQHQDNWVLVDNQSRVLCSINDHWIVGEKLSSPEWSRLAIGDVYRQTVEKNDVAMVGYRWYEPAAKVAAFAAAPVFDSDGVKQGVLIVQLNKDWLDVFVDDRQNLGDTGEITLGYFRPDGQTTTLITPRYPIDALRQKQALAGGKIPLEIALQGQEGMGRSFDYRGEPVLSAWLYDDELALGLVVKQDIKELVAPLKASRSVFIDLIIILSILMLLVIWFLSRRISLPITQVAQHVKLLGSGHESFEPLPVSVSQSKELAALVEGINNTSLQLTDQLDKLATQSRYLEEQKAVLEVVNANLEEVVIARTAELKSYIDIVDEHVITSRTDLLGNITYASKAFCQISGYSKEELLGKNHRILRHPSMSAELYQDLWKTIVSGQVWHGEICNMAKNGSTYWVDATIYPILDKSGHSTGYMAVRQNISDRKQAELLAITDEMTGLYNRRHFNEQMDILWRLAARNEEVLALLMLDVDFFKSYNDTFGHKAGDDALKAVSTAMRSAIGRAADAAFRLGGEEMAILMLMNQHDALTIAHRIQQKLLEFAISHPSNVDHNGLLTVSIGICYFDGMNCRHDSHPQIDELYQLADRALYQAKEQGRNRIVISDKTITCHDV